MSDYTADLSDEEKIQIVSRLLTYTPPGEFNTVYNDLRELLKNNEILSKSVNSMIANYNKNQMASVHIKEYDHWCLITEFNDLGNGNFYDPRSKQQFKFDHLTKQATNFQNYEIDQKIESWRSIFENEVIKYTAKHYQNGICSVFGKIVEDDLNIVICIEDHQYQSKYYWGGKWRSLWHAKFNKDNCQKIELKGDVKVQVHYYEDGNVHLITTKDFTETLDLRSTKNVESIAKELVDFIEENENQYQRGLLENYQTMSDSIFKALRRQLPVTKTKIDWNRIVEYNIGKELKTQ